VAVFGYSLEGKPPYHGLVIGLLVSGAMFWAANSRLFKPQRDELAGMETRLVDLRGKIQQGRAAEQRLPQFREEVERLELELEKLLRILPSKRNTPELLQGMRRLAEDEDFNLRLFRSSKEVEREFYSEYPIAVELDGNYHSLARFFERIGNFSRIINIDDLRVQALRDQTSFRTIQATFTAKTFVYKEPDEDEATDLELQ
jgi:type IV pilus assembly protein PilO